ncbi:hypothetical protein BDN72DRAFT_766352, partial [Pluteus cervinus]
DRPNILWTDERDKFLEEFVRLDGRGDSMGQELCLQCHSAKAVYRCQDCFVTSLFCSECIVSRHTENPLHWIEKGWTGTHFSRTSLKILGLRIQVGHTGPGPCSNRKVAFNDAFIILHTNGLHEVGLDYCKCAFSAPYPIQLLRYRLYPATLGNPQTAASFTLLRHAHILSFESKCSVYELYHTISRLSDNSGVVPQRNRYQSLLNMLRQYRNLKMLKRAGRVYEEGGIKTTGAGQLAILCPACPHPGINLSPNWMHAPAEKRYFSWLYALFLSIDANFRLRRRLKRTTDAQDPSLSPGCAYFVNSSDYREHLSQFDTVIDQPKSTCSNHSAVNSERSTRGLSVTGVGSVGCARHNFFRPNAVGDLQKGERYVNMDFIFFSSLLLTAFGMLVVSYDIACQWYKNIWTRMNKYPPELRISGSQKPQVRFFVPKFHLPAHVGSCQTTFSFNLNQNVGRTDGEAPERGWSHLNPLATSTVEMGPGSRRDTLDDHFGDWNWRKTKAMGTTLKTKSISALHEAAESKQDYEDMEQGLPPEIVSRWKVQVALWENNHQHPNPYVILGKGPTQDSIRKDLAAEDARDIASGAVYILHEDYTASELITVGLELEHRQRKLCKEQSDLGANPTYEQEARFQGHMNSFQLKVEGWIQAQGDYMPTTRPLRRALPNEIAIQDLPLYLPSSIINGAACDQRLREIEWRLRYAQAGDALNEVRNHLRSRSYLYKLKDSSDRGQKANTRSQGFINRVGGKLTLAVAKYRASHAAMTNLSRHLDHPGWATQYRELQESDVQGLTVELKVGEGYRASSWIWGAFNSGQELRNDENVHDCVRVEWCKARARAMRWAEEVELLEEETRRVTLFMASQSLVWFERIALIPDGSQATPQVVEGRIAYAHKQAQLRKDLGAFFKFLWSLDAIPQVQVEGVDGDEQMDGEHVEY